MEERRKRTSNIEHPFDYAQDKLTSGAELRMKSERTPARAGTSLRSAPRVRDFASLHSTCENCRFSRWVSGLAEPTLICEHKAESEDKCLVVDPAGVCANFDDHGHAPAALAAALAEGAKLIPLTQGKFAIVDAENYEQLSKYRWYAVKSRRTYYAIRSVKRSRVQIRMHRMLLNAPPGLLVDHINNNGLDNRRSYLRLCTRAQNALNQRPRRGTSSRYKGVGWDKSKKKFRASITHHYKRIHLGYFDDEIDAAKAYDKKAKELFGEFAYLNFPNDATEPRT